MGQPRDSSTGQPQNNIGDLIILTLTILLTVLTPIVSLTLQTVLTRLHILTPLSLIVAAEALDKETLDKEPRASRPMGGCTWATHLASKQ